MGSADVSFIPLIPYESHEEYEELLLDLKNNYMKMVQKGIDLANLPGWCSYYCGLSLGVRGHWLENGTGLYLKLTKGLGKEWCDTVNTFVVHSLDTALRVMIQTHGILGRNMRGTQNDKTLISLMFKREVPMVIRDDSTDPNLMYSFEHVNFEYIMSWDDDMMDDAYYCPRVKFQEMQLSFVMGLHSRLGNNSIVRILSDEMTKLIFSDQIF